MQINRIAEALGESPLELRRRWVYLEGDVTPTGQVLRESVGGSEVLEAAAEASGFDHHRQQTAEARERRGSGRTAGQRHRSGAGLARGRFHGQWRGEAGVGRIGRADRRPPHPDPDRLDRDGPGHQDDLSAAGGGCSWASSTTRSRSRRRTPRSSRTPAQRSPAAPPWSSAACSSRPPRSCGGRWRRRPGVRSPTRTARPAAPGRRAVQPVSRRPLRRQDLHRRCLSGVRLGGGGGQGGRGPGHRRGHRPRVRGRGRHRPRHPSGAGRGPGGGRLAAGHRLCHHRGDEAGRRPLPERPSGDLPDPDRAGCAAHPQHPGREAVLRRAAWRQGRRRAAHGRRSAGGGCRHPRRDRRLDPRSAGYARSASWLP